MDLYFNDNFFSAGTTAIMDANGSEVGSLDLKSAFGSSIDIYGASGERLYTGQFQFPLNRWKVLDANGEEAGTLRSRFSLMSKKFEYDAGERGLYEIRSPNFSKEYSITENDGEVAFFAKTNGWLHADAYVLRSGAARLEDYELVAVVMGVNAIVKRQQSSSG